jgi:hypothetical protein
MSMPVAFFDRQNVWMNSPLSRNSQFDLGYQAEDAACRVGSMNCSLPRRHVDDRDLSPLDGIAV